MSLDDQLEVLADAAAAAPRPSAAASDLRSSIRTTSTTHTSTAKARRYATLDEDGALPQQQEHEAHVPSSEPPGFDAIVENVNRKISVSLGPKKRRRYAGRALLASSCLLVTAMVATALGALAHSSHASAADASSSSTGAPTMPHQPLPLDPLWLLCE